MLARLQMVTRLLNLKPLVQAGLHTDWVKSCPYLWAVLAVVNVRTEEYGPLSHQMQIMVPIQQKTSVFQHKKNQQRLEARLMFCDVALFAEIHIVVCD